MLANIPSSRAAIISVALASCLEISGLYAEDPRPAPLPPAANRTVDFTTDIKPIFEQNCLRCHGANHPKGGFSLTTATAAWRGGDNGPAIIPGDSTNSPLIHLVAQLDPDSVMPPTGKGEPLSPAQVALLRAWIDQGAWWGTETHATATVSIAPAAQFTTVSGNHKKFAEHYGQREGWRGGVESFSLFQQVSPDTRLTLDGHAMTDDYRADLLVENPSVGFYRFGFQQFRTYDADTGGFSPLFTQPIISLNRNLHLDVGRAWVDFGLTRPDWPRMVLGYEYQFRRGDKSTLQWGYVSEGPQARNIYPGFKHEDERTHILKFDLAHELHGWHLENNFRGEWTTIDTRRENVSSVALDVPNSMLRDRVDEGWKSFQGANTFRVERAMRDWLFASAGYLYSHLTADADFSLDYFNPSGAPVSAFLQRSEWRSQQIILERESHVSNANLLFGPWHSSTLAIGAQAEFTRQNGTLAGTQTEFVAPPFNGPPFNFPDTINPLGGLTDIDRATVDETVALRINRLPFTTIFVEGRLQQERIQHAESTSGIIAFSRDTEADSNLYDLRFGFDTSPLAWLKMGSHYRWRDKTTTYDDGYADGDPADLPGYPTLISQRDLTTHEIVSRLTLRPATWVKTTFTHRIVATDFHTTTEPVTFGTPGDGSPGGRNYSGNYDAQIFSLNVTVTPTRRFHAFSTLSFHDTSSRAQHDFSTAVAPYRGEVWSVLCHGRYVLTAKTDLTAGYTFSTANFRQDLLTDGLALGMRYDSHAVTAGLTSRCTENLTTKLQYGFYQYAEPTSGRANNYTAHAVFLSLHLLLN
jgi:mono/diheme cytochrome c family protein